MKNSFVWNSVNTLQIRDRLQVIIKNFQEAFPDLFEKTELKICKKCNGAGIPIKKGSSDEITFWNPGTYCDECGGIGYLGIKRIYDKYICSCEGKDQHCPKCKGDVVIDWISNIMGGTNV